jgi:hypothetical protein
MLVHLDGVSHVNEITLAYIPPLDVVILCVFEATSAPHGSNFFIVGATEEKPRQAQYVRNL